MKNNFIYFLAPLGNDGDTEQHKYALLTFYLINFEHCFT